MLKKEVTVPGLYRAKVGDVLTVVRLTATSTYGGYNAVNLATNREVRIKSAAKLRDKVTDEQAAVLLGRTRKLNTTTEPEVYVPTESHIRNASVFLQPGRNVYAMVLTRRDGSVFGAKFLVAFGDVIHDVTSVVCQVSGDRYHEGHSFAYTDDPKKTIEKVGEVLFKHADSFAFHKL